MAALDFPSIAGVGLTAGLVGAGAALLVAAATGGRPCQDGTPSPADLGVQIADPMKDLDAMREYGRKLRFEPPGKEQPLSYPRHQTGTGQPTGGFDFGPRSRVRAASCSHENQADPDLVEGRIVAQVHVVIPGNQNWPFHWHPNPRFQTGYHKGHWADHDNDGQPDHHVHSFFPEGHSYVWIDGYDAARGTARAVIVSAKPNDPYVAEAIVDWTPDTPHAQAHGYWIADPTDDHLWQTCSTNGCCTVRALE